MKKILPLIICFFLVKNAFAQFTEKTNFDNAFTKQKKELKRNKAILLNTIMIKDLEQTLFFSASAIDMRFKKGKSNGFGFSAGLGTALNYNAIEDFAYFEINDSKGIDHPKFITIPISINYLIGKKNHHIELGIEALSAIITGKALNYNGIIPTKTNYTTFRISPFPLIGYRYQPKGKGLMVNAIWRPMPDYFTTITPIFSLGVGYGF